MLFLSWLINSGLVDMALQVMWTSHEKALPEHLSSGIARYLVLLFSLTGQFLKTGLPESAIIANKV